jgi:putative ABC transport system substrate-binding protein
MNRREFITFIGGAAASWPLGARAQQGNRIPRVGFLFPGAKGRNYDRFVTTLTKTLLELGWTEGKNIQIDYRVADNDFAQIKALAREIVRLKPDVILASTTPAVAAFQRETRNIPIVFIGVTDPVASRLVASLSHPGGNITGFSNYEPTLVGKHIEILKEITPGMTAVSDMFNPDTGRHAIVGPSLGAVAQHLTVELISAPVSNDSDIEHVISSIGDKGTIGLDFPGEPFFEARYDLIISLTTRYHAPTISTFRLFVEAGGLISYGNDQTEQRRQAVGYIDRILKGANPADLPVQEPTKFQMVINLKTAKAMGITIPPTLLARADEVIE